MWQVTLFLALLGLGFLIAAQLASEGPRIRYTSQERTPLVGTVVDLQAQQEDLKKQILALRSGIQDMEAVGQGGATVTKDLNSRLQAARIAAGLVAMSGPGLVIQLSDSSAPVPPGSQEGDYSVSGQDVRTVVEQLWLAGAEAIAVNGERVTVATAVEDIGGSVLVNSAYLAPRTRYRPSVPQTCSTGSRNRPGSGTSSGRAESFGIGVGYAASDGGPAGLRGLGEPAVRTGGCQPGAGRPQDPAQRRGVRPDAQEPRPGPLGMVLFFLGFLVVVQLRSQTTDQGLNALSVQELGELVGNLTTRNNQLREEISTLQRQSDAIGAAAQRGDTSAAQIRSDLTRILGWSGAAGVTGSGVRVTIDGHLPGDAVELLLNELRNAGAEAISLGPVRVVPGVVVTGPQGRLVVAGVPLREPLEVLAVGQPDTLAGSLARVGGPIAQLAARYPNVTVTVAAADRIAVPATNRSLTPVLGKPRL